MSRLQLAIEQIVFARDYTIGLLDQTPAIDWFRQPPGGVSHIAWQVGHLAFGEYSLALREIRGPQPLDIDLLFGEAPDSVRAGLSAGPCPHGVPQRARTPGRV